jgi:hypothetical protein
MHTCLQLTKHVYVCAVLSSVQMSTKCYSYVELQEVPPAGGPMTCEAYKKPVNATRKSRPALLTTKPLYLQLRLVTQHH